jgi:hypothetical protein
VAENAPKRELHNAFHDAKKMTNAKNGRRKKTLSAGWWIDGIDGSIPIKRFPNGSLNWSYITSGWIL